MIEKKIKMSLVCSVGGHLNSLLHLEPLFMRHEFSFVTFYSPILEDFQYINKCSFLVDPKRNPFKFILCFFQSLRYFLKFKPDIIISNGGGIAIPMLLLSYVFRKKIVFIEDACRITSPSVTGRIAYFLADIFLVQWAPLLKRYPKGRYVGLLL